jgi:hypothetical protein
MTFKLQNPRQILSASARRMRRRRNPRMEHIGGWRVMTMTQQSTNTYRLEGKKEKRKRLRNTIKRNIS